MEAVICGGVVVLFAVKGLDNEIKLQPSVAKYPTFTDSTYVVQILGFIEVKKRSVDTALGSDTTQTLREVQIALSNSGDDQQLHVVQWCSRTPSTNYNILLYFLMKWIGGKLLLNA